MAQFNESAVKTLVSGTALAIFLRVKFGSSGTAGQMIVATAADACIGVVERAVFVQGEDIPVRMRTAQGTIPMVASEAIALGATVYAAAGGKVAASGTVIEGTAMQAATANGDHIEVLKP